MSYKFVNIKPPFDITVDFWEENFQVSLIEPFRSLYLRDTTKNKTTSSKEMWCIWLSEDPNYDNKVYRLKPDQKKTAILSYYPEFNFKDELIAQCLLEYKEHCLTPTAKAFRKEEESMIKRADFIDNAEYTFPSIATDDLGRNIYVSGKPLMLPGTAKDIDAMRKLSLDLAKKYEQIRKIFEEEQNEVRIFGGGKENLMEKGGLVMIHDNDEEE